MLPPGKEAARHPGMGTLEGQVAEQEQPGVDEMLAEVCECSPPAMLRFVRHGQAPTRWPLEWPTTAPS
jgi:hypothetical protein